MATRPLRTVAKSIQYGLRFSSRPARYQVRPGKLRRAQASSARELRLRNSTSGFGFVGEFCARFHSSAVERPRSKITIAFFSPELLGTPKWSCRVLVLCHTDRVNEGGHSSHPINDRCRSHHGRNQPPSPDERPLCPDRDPLDERGEERGASSGHWNDVNQEVPRAESVIGVAVELDEIVKDEKGQWPREQYEGDPPCSRPPIARSSPAIPSAGRRRPPCVLTNRSPKECRTSIGLLWPTGRRNAASG